MDMSTSVPQLHTLHFNVTNTCNLSCSFCYIDAVKEKTSDVPLDRILSLAKEARNVGGQRVILSGGEAFARKDWFDIFKIFDDEEFVLSIVSNGTLLPAKRIEKLAKLKNVNILISLDGDEKNHDIIRGQEGSQKKTVECIHQLKEANINVQVNATIIKTNLEDVAYLTRLSRDLDVSMRLSLLNPYNGRGKNEAPLALDTDEIIAVRDFCHAARLLGSKVFINIPPLLQHADDVIPIRSPACGWTKSYCGVTYDGNVTICGVAGADKTLYAGNVMEQSFEEIWADSPLFNRLRSLKTSDLKGVCGRCPVREQCGGACRLSAYKSKDDFTQSYSMCQTFYDMGYIPEDVLDPEPENLIAPVLPPEISVSFSAARTP